MYLKKIISSTMAAVMIMSSSAGVLANERNNTSPDDAPTTISAEVTQNGYAYVGELKNVSEIESVKVSFSAVSNKGNNLAWSTEKNEDVTGDEYNSYFEKNKFLAWSSARVADTAYAAAVPTSSDSNGSAYVYVWSDAACTVTVDIAYKKTEIKYISVEANDNKISYNVSYNTKEDENILYTALYDESGRLTECRMNKPKGIFDVLDGKYTVKSFIWNENLQPMCGAVSREVAVQNGKTENGEVLWRSTTNSDRWLDENGQTYYAIVKRNSQMVIAMPSNDDGVRAQQQTFTGRDNQLWKLDFIMGESNFKTKDMELKKLGSELSAADDLKTALNAGGEYTLTEDITLDGCNNTITATGTGKDAAIYQNGHTSKIDNLIIQGNTKKEVGVWMGSGAVTEFNNVTIKGFNINDVRYAALAIGTATVSLNNSTFMSNNQFDIDLSGNPVLNINEGTKLESIRLATTTAKINIKYIDEDGFKICVPDFSVNRLCRLPKAPAHV